MYIEERNPYWFTDKGIAQIEAMREATYMGYWCGKTKSGDWGEVPMDVFFTPNPDVEEGHTHYFGLLVQDGKVLIADATSCFSEVMSGIVENETVYVSRFMTDSVQTPLGQIIDGGRDYTRASQDASFVTVSVKDDGFEFSGVLDDNDIEESEDDTGINPDNND